MNKLKRVSLVTLGGIILLATTSFAKTGVVNAPSGLVLREKTSKTSEPITTVEDKAKVEILDESGEWYKVKYNNNEGYLFAEYVDVNEDEEKKEEKTETPKEESATEQKEETETNSENNTIKKEKQYPQEQKTKADLKIYSIPSITANSIASVKKGKEITINYELNNWVNVTYGKNTGWARKYFIDNENETLQTNAKGEETDKKSEDNKSDETTKTIENKKGYVDVSSSANIRKEANTSSEILDTLLRNAEITIIAEEGDFYKIQYKDVTGYISKSLVSDKPVSEVTSRSSAERKATTTKESNTTSNDKTENTSKKIESASKKTENTNKKTVASNSSVGNDVVSYAKKYVGYNYTYGGSSPSTGFDCSGFTYYVFNSCGYSLSRSCQVQAKSGSAVSRENLSAGDLVFFDNGSNGSIGHVGIYIGGGRFIHAENSRTGVRTDTLNSGYYNKYYYSARRITK